jgi:protein required for attachment to host cells
MGTMVAVLSQRELKLFRREDPSGKLFFEKSLQNNLEHERNIDISRHHPGVISEGGHGVSRHVMDGGQSPHDLATRQFARNVGRFLETESKAGHWSKLVVIAEPRLMGEVRSEMPEPLKKMTARWVSKDLEKATTPTLEAAVNTSLTEA